MSTQPPTPAPITAPAAGPNSETPEVSERVRLARVALRAALAVPGVRRGDRGALHTHVTADPAGGPLLGVTCTALSGGGYEISLQLVAAMVPLHALGVQVVDHVRSAARIAGLSSLLESVSVHFADIDAGSQQ